MIELPVARPRGAPLREEPVILHLDDGPQPGLHDKSAMRAAAEQRQQEKNVHRSHSLTSAPDCVIAPLESFALDSAFERERPRPARMSWAGLP